MVEVPAGTFDMGASDVADAPVHVVRLAAFKIDKTGVTVAAYAVCVDAGRCTVPDTTKFCNWKVSGRENHPVNCVDLNQATEFCSFAGKRLPTEEEWEYAARGNDGRKYPWGNAAPSNQLCWSGQGSDLGGDRRSTCPVGSYPSGASPFGVLDLAGNVWEWTSSTFDTAGAAPVLRGSAWSFEDAAFMRAAGRHKGAPVLRGYMLGFRCARNN
jgi:formylglycine-generating enzyme required for sulfatase activity